jgi:uncharacterized membrane protein
MKSLTRQFLIFCLVLIVGPILVALLMELLCQIGPAQFKETFYAIGYFMIIPMFFGFFLLLYGIPILGLVYLIKRMSSHITKRKKPGEPPGHTTPPS